MLALAALARLASVSAGWPQDATLAAALFWWPSVGGLLAGAVIALLLKPKLMARRVGATGT